MAKIYNCKNGTKTINQAVKRHLNRFPKDFCFRLTNNYGGVRKLPYAFTEQGVAMLSAVLRTPLAEEVSVKIMRAFVIMRHFISDNISENQYINDMVFRHDEEIRQLEYITNNLKTKELVNQIYFNGQIYDAYSKLIDILNEASDEIIIIDSYADKSVLDIICNIDKPVTLITTNRYLKHNDIKKYSSQYNNLKIIYNNTFHDRYIILDKSKIYNLGTSINHMGKKTFGINLIMEEVVIKALLNKMKEVI